jgi:predicted amidohydrolase YtcJ
MIRALLAATTALALSAPALADTLVDNVDGLTIDATGGIERFTGLLVGDDGRIVQVLKRGDKRPGKVDYFVDGKGQVMVPGMIDSHGHLRDLGFGALTLDLSEARSLNEALAKVAAYAKANPDRPWILGRGWNQELWPEKRFPTAAELDSAVADRPVWLERADSHAGWANSRALAAAGVTALTKAPAGGSIERLVGGKPAGVLVDNAMDLVNAAVPAPRPEDRDLAFAKAQEILLERGVTAIADMGTTIEDWQTFRRAGDNGSLRIRIMAYAKGTEAMALIGGPGPSPWLYDDKLRLNGVKLYSDGALGSRGASLKAPYSDAPTAKGLRVTGDTQLKNFMSRAALDRFQVAVHAIGDEANAAALSAIEDMNQTYTGDRRWRIEHAQVVDPADIPRFAKAGVIASMQPVHQTSDRLMAEARLGPNRLTGAYAWASLAASGAKLAFGSDVPVELADPWAGLAAAISRTGPDGQPFGGWQPQERVSRELALNAYTAGGAYAGFAEGRFGRLQRGERADFLLIDRDPLLATPAEIRATQVMQVWVGGRLVHQRTN